MASMEEKEFRAHKARIAYKRYLAALPRCDKCDKCMFVNDRKNAKRLCTEMREIVENCVKTCPRWCPKRK